LEKGGFKAIAILQLILFFIVVLQKNHEKNIAFISSNIKLIIYSQNMLQKKWLFFAD